MDIPECSKALLLSEAMLDPLHTSSELSPAPVMLHCEGEAPGTEAPAPDERER